MTCDKCPNKECKYKDESLCCCQDCIHNYIKIERKEIRDICIDCLEGECQFKLKKE